MTVKKVFYFQSGASKLKKLDKEISYLVTGAEESPNAAEGLLDQLEGKLYQRDKIAKHIEARKAAFAAAPPDVKQATIGHIGRWRSSNEKEITYSEVRPFSFDDFERTRKSQPGVEVVARLPIVNSERTPVAMLLLKSPLFAASRRKAGPSEPVDLKLGDIAFGGRRCTVRMEGPQLTTSHGDAFFFCLDYIKHMHFDEWVEVSASDFLRSIGRNETSGNNHSALLEDLKEMHKATFFVEYEEGVRKRVLAGGWRLIEYHVDYASQGRTLNPQARIRFRIPTKTAMLFGLGAWCVLDTGLRSSLKSALTKWLYGYVCTGPQGNALISEVRGMSGSRQGSSQFRSSLESAIEELKKRDVLTQTSFLTTTNKFHWTRAKWLRPGSETALPSKDEAGRSKDGRDTHFSVATVK
jgi:hypothetical protein